jgi:hypothetical protein
MKITLIQGGDVFDPEPIGPRRTLEIQLSDIVSSGVTTPVSCLGTDGTTRHMTTLLAKARGPRPHVVQACDGDPMPKLAPPLLPICSTLFAA